MPTAVPPEALEVLNMFLEAGLRRDEPAMRACLSAKTLEAGQFDGSSPQNVRYVFGDGVIEGETVVVPVRAYPLEGPAAGDPAEKAEMEMPCVMIQEGGKWKFDLVATTQRMFSGGIDAMMGETAAALGTAMEGVAQALGDVMKEAFGGETAAKGPGQDWMVAPLEITPEELLPLPALTPLPTVSVALSEACGSPVEAVVALDDIMKIFDADERDTMFTWFNDQLFSDFGRIFGMVGQTVPLTGRLRALRIEDARNSDNRMLVLDGSDLVYRMALPNTAGYYSDEFVLDMLPGILAALPEKPDPVVTGHRLIHNNDEQTNFDLYKERVVPRYMRRIGELLGGKYVSLEAEWSDIYNTYEDGRQIYRWGLNRIYGAIALLCLDAGKRAELTEKLEAIHLIFGSNVAERFAHFKNGKLTVSLYYYPGEVGCFYERDLVRVLQGEAIRYEGEGAEAAEAEAADDDTSEDEVEASEAAVEDAEDDEKDPTAGMDETERAKALNDENFRSAAASLKENEPMWSMQLELLFQRKIPVSLNFDSLQGDYALVQPFIHQGLTATLEAMTKVAFDPACKKFADRIQGVSISGGMGSSVSIALSDGVLSVRVPLDTGDVPPPTAKVFEALQDLAALSA